MVFPRQRVVVFCDGDFWHGRDWTQRKAKLSKGANADYWVPKIEYNMERAAQQREELEENGWRVIRCWEGEINENAEAVVKKVEDALLQSGSADRSE